MEHSPSPSETKEIVATLAVTPSLARISHDPNPFRTPELIVQYNESEQHAIECERPKIALSFYDRSSHDTVQDHLPSSLILSSQSIDSWTKLYGALLTTSEDDAPCPTVGVQPYGLHTVDLMDITLRTDVARFDCLETLSLRIEGPISRIDLNNFRSHFVPEAVNLKTLNIHISGIDEFGDYACIVRTFMSFVSRLEALDWTCTFEDDTNVFFHHLEMAKNVERLNLCLQEAYIHPSFHFKARLASLRCLQIAPVGRQFGNQYDLLGDWDFPLLSGLLVRGKNVYPELEYFLDMQVNKLRQLYVEHLWGNENIVQACFRLERFLFNMGVDPFIVASRLSMPSLIMNQTVKFIIIANIRWDTYEVELLYRFANRDYFPSLRGIQILAFHSKKVNFDGWPTIAAIGFADCLLACHRSGIVFLDIDGKYVNLF